MLTTSIIGAHPTEWYLFAGFLVCVEVSPTPESQVR